MTTGKTVSVEVQGATVLGRSLQSVAQAFPKLLDSAVRMQCRNVQKAMAATTRNYAIKSKVDGKTKVLKRFRKRDKITVALHGRKGGGALGVPSGVSFRPLGPSTFTIGWKGRLPKYAEKWQTGSSKNDSRSFRLRVYSAFAKSEYDAALQDPETRRELYRRLGSRFGIHTREELLAAADPAMRSVVSDMALQVVVDRAGELELALPNVPTSWEGRPFIEQLADDVRARFIPSVVSIMEKKIKGKIPLEAPN